MSHGDFAVKNAPGVTRRIAVTAISPLMERVSLNNFEDLNACAIP